MAVLLHTELPGLTLLSKGKVRDIYATSDPDRLLFVATDRISAYDVILQNGIPDKGRLLTKISVFWFEKLKSITGIPNHFVTADVNEMPAEVLQYKDQLEGRAMLVRKAEVVPLEAIVRGYLTGSAWAEYKKTSTVHGVALDKVMHENEKFDKPVFTPSTKAKQGAHDENISPDQARELLGQELYASIEKASLDLYRAAADYALSKGLILVDTKFEFGLIPSQTGEGKELILIDEVLTPDSSRYWLKDDTTDKGHKNLDKQFLRDWLVRAGFKKGLESGPEGKEGQGWVIDQDVVDKTSALYSTVVDTLMSA